MRKFITALVLALGVIFTLTHFSDFEGITEVWQQGMRGYLLLALIVEAVWLFNLSVFFRAVYRALGIEKRIKNLLVLVTASYFVGTVTPTGGMGAMVLYIDDAQRNGHSTGRATAAGALYTLFDFAAFFCFLSLGLAALWRRDNLTSAEIGASIIMVLAACVLAVILYLAMRSGESLGKFLAWATHLINALLRPFIQRDYIPTKRAYTFSAELSEGLSEIRKQPSSLGLPFLLALNNKALLFLIMFLIFKAFNVPVSAGTLFAGFSVAYLFLIVSPTPSGLGFVEFILPLTLSSMFIPIQAATIITLGYRFITFWTPLLVGMIAFRIYNHQEIDPVAPVPNSAVSQRENIAG
ncbi:MAG: flippase-like domain-containing protein [Anaerolineales bacterium]|nr:flippase-like domain-containing protein [Anaerolineales bacterium]